ncbi:type VI secretion system membrane subunit TssM [Vibrio sp. JC009]|uniref:type VI secretion system membrane subunit TssM n=1 Tax=Vibrio sp. JC009 TaxID=2912314 RepID=UPI0023B029BB|nr:type VI secretion system membrane subunit TssM [Vibrio sp. JC009]WED24546.1 type VI secretion system membrane subunit TssM [Vibrio sp. JC009]
MLNRMVKVVKKNKQSFTLALKVLLVLLFVVVNLVVWWVGPWLEIFGNKPFSSVSSRVLFTCFSAFIAVAVWGIRQRRKLVQLVTAQEKARELRDDPVKRSIDRQDRELETLRSKLRQQVNKHNYLYALPWYLVIGLNGDGKSSLIRRSGQKFLDSAESAVKSENRGKEGSVNWWFSNHAVLIEPGGQLVEQGALNQTDGQGEIRLWQNLLAWLENTRSRRPLNGLIIAVDIARLAEANSSERRIYASLLRARMREMMESLSTRLPVYITLTKLDLLYGFEPFFRQCSAKQRDDIFGFTFSLDSADAPEKWLAEFDADYARFVATLNKVLPQKVSEPLSSEERKGIYSFVRQIAGIRSILADFLCDLFTCDQFSTTALVRGVYFTSVYQQGVPNNTFDDVTSKRYGLPYVVNRAQNAKHSMVYFVENLFGQIIFCEAGIAGDNFRLVKQKRRLIAVSVAVCLTVTFLLTASWHRYYKSNILSSDAVLTKVNHYKEQFPDQIAVASICDILEPLNKIREATLEFGFFRDKSQYISDLGLYQGHVIGPKVEDTYLNLLEMRFLPLLMADLIVEMQQTTNSEDKLGVLRVYRMLVDKSGRYSSYVLDYFSKYWQSGYSGKKSIQEQLMGHLDYAMQHTDLAYDRNRGDEALEKIMQPYDEVIAKAQSELGAMPNDQRVYRSLKLTAETVLGPDINLRNLIGPVFDVVFEERVLASDKLLIPRMMTREGFDDYFLPQSESISKLALIDAWVLGQSKSPSFSEADKQVLKAQIRDLYVADYTATWRAALNDIDIRYFSDINDAVTVLDNLTGSMEPLQRVLRSLRSHTKLYGALPDSESAKAELKKSAKYAVSLKIEEPFLQLTSLLSPVNGKPAYFNEVLTLVEVLKSYMNTIKNAPDAGMAALKATKDRVQMMNSDPIYTLHRVASGLPAPLDGMLTKLADESWYVVKQEAIKHLELRWQEDVYTYYQQRLAGKYPFASASKKDVSLKDFELFFAPDGVLGSFHKNQLNIFLQENVGVSQDETGKSLIRKDIVELIEGAEKIREAFFNRKGILDLSFFVEPLQLSNNKRRSVLNVDGQILVYSHGQKYGADFIWPNTLRDSAKSKITLVPAGYNQSPRSMSVAGPWALFRLLEKGNVISISPVSVDYKFVFEGGNMVYRISSEEETNPFTNELFKSFKVSETLY